MSATLDRPGTKPEGGGAVLLTGATGFVGMELLARYLERSDRPVYALVRASDPKAARARMRDILIKLFGDAEAHADQVTAVPGDIESEGLGLDPWSRARLAEEVTDVVHAAASVSFTLPLDRSREINLGGTRRVLDFALQCRERGGLRRFSYISTAYVAGTHAGRFGEDQFNVGQGFRNAYERSKFEAERVVRSCRDRLPVRIFRPSIIVGERGTGWTAAFNVLYAPLKAFSRGGYRVVPAHRSAPVDVVPVDYVADAVFELSEQPAGADAGADTFHLVAGARATTVGRLIDLAARYFGRPLPRTLPPALYRRFVYPLAVRLGSAAARRGLRKNEVYYPYFSMRVFYDNRQARRRLEPAGIRVPPVERYFDALADFATRTSWGRVQLTRPQAASARASSRDRGRGRSERGDQLVHAPGDVVAGGPDLLERTLSRIR